MVGEEEAVIVSRSVCWHTRGRKESALGGPGLWDMSARLECCCLRGVLGGGPRAPAVYIPVDEIVLRSPLVLTKKEVSFPGAKNEYSRASM